AVLSLGLDDLHDMLNRIDALRQMKQDPNFEALAGAFKRVVNIMKDQTPGSVDPACFQQDEEQALYDKHLEIRDRVQQLIDQKAYVDALTQIATIRQTVDDFFDNVLVMAKEEQVKQNRLALLQEISFLFTNFADFSRIAAE
ncbi:MAG: glycine--tRNA ligase subunit beta, partial [Deltaproteobacteria bacterium]|nr:glycine--tRNA ligase subunit beta [Deltaproteobacteria bacterium]